MHDTIPGELGIKRKPLVVRFNSRQAWQCWYGAGREWFTERFVRWHKLRLETHAYITLVPVNGCRKPALTRLDHRFRQHRPTATIASHDSPLPLEIRGREDSIGVEKSRKQAISRLPSCVLLPFSGSLLSRGLPIWDPDPRRSDWLGGGGEIWRVFSWSFCDVVSSKERSFGVLNSFLFFFLLAFDSVPRARPQKRFFFFLGKITSCLQRDRPLFSFLSLLLKYSSFWCPSPVNGREGARRWAGRWVMREWVASPASWRARDRRIGWRRIRTRQRRPPPSPLPRVGTSRSLGSTRLDRWVRMRRVKLDLYMISLIFCCCCKNWIFPRFVWSFLLLVICRRQHFLIRAPPSNKTEKKVLLWGGSFWWLWFVIGHFVVLCACYYFAFVCYLMVRFAYPWRLRILDPWSSLS